jgi:hypothetical protein
MQVCKQKFFVLRLVPARKHFIYTVSYFIGFTNWQQHYTVLGEIIYIIQSGTTAAPQFKPTSTLFHNPAEN